MMLEFAAKLIFWSSVAALFYTYAGYPMLLFLVSTLRPKPVRRGTYQPSVSVIITAYNEERDIQAKLENTLALDYPRELVEIIVASDCSTDRTDEIALQFADRGVRLHRQVERLGKTAAQNIAVELAHGEIIVFSDATSDYEPNVLRAIMPNFADSSVGCVAGRLIYVDPENSRVGLGARAYWAYETFLKKHESLAVSLIGASGCLYAVRKCAYVPLYHEACSDFIIATKMVEQGLRTVYAPEAVSIEQTNRSSDKELTMRVRVIAQTFAELWRHRAMINPLNSGFYGVQLFSHKVLRYLVPFFLIAILPTSAVLATDSPFYSVVLAVQFGFYLAAFLSWILEHTGVHSSLLALPQYFVLANLASLLGFYKFLRGERYTVWQPIRQSTPEAKLKEIQLAVDLNQGHSFSRAAEHTPETITAADFDVQKAPVVSVIIPAYNVAEYIGETLASVFAQTFRDFEVIVINDGSSDTEELECALAPYRTRINYITQENRGLSGARNTGIRAARAPFVALLDADDLWEPDYLAAQLAEFASDQTIDVVYPNAVFFGNTTEAGQEYMKLCPSEGEVTFESLVRQRCQVMVSVTARRDSIMRAGFFDESLRSVEDFDLWLRIVKQGGRIGYHRRVLVRYRRRAGSLSDDRVWMCEHALKVLAKAETTLDLTTAERRAINEAAARFRVSLRFQRGKRAFIRGDAQVAITELTGANAHLRSPKLALSILGLRVAPQLLLWLYNVRDRHYLKTSTRFLNTRMEDMKKVVALDKDTLKGKDVVNG